MTRRQWTNAAEVARLAGLSRARVHQILAAGNLEGVVRVNYGGANGSWRIPVSSATAWLKARGITGVKWQRSPESAAAYQRVADALAKATETDLWVGA